MPFPSDSKPDSQVETLIEKERTRQTTGLQLIASENFTSPAVMRATGSVLTNKYSEGYPGKRYYGGNAVVDEIEALAIDRVKQLFGADHANVQPHSGASANMAVYQAMLKPGDVVLGLSLDHGGHLTHGSPVNASGIFYDFRSYKVGVNDERIDFDEVRRLAHEHRPRMIVAGTVRPFESVTIWARDSKRAGQLVARLTMTHDENSAGQRPRWQVADDLARAFSSADVVCTVTSAKTPIISGEWCRAGQHLNLVGSAIPTTAEVDDLTVSRARFFVDYREAAFAAAGELLGAISRGVVDASHVRGEIGEVFAGHCTGRETDTDITLYKSLGVTTQDLAAGMRLMRDAAAIGAGVELALDA
ncbi:MAG: hypothetical protein EBY04_04335 [Actinobacteria bacterium]|nr:hypothetical protein [Actinomycetota bacterium]